MKRQSASRPQGPEDFYADHEEYSRQVLADADFPVYAVDRGAPGGGVHRADPARGGESAPPGGGTGAAEAGEDSDALAEYELRNGELGWVEVRSGDWSSAEGPYVTVRTYRPGTDTDQLPELEDVVEDERDRVFEQLGVDEGDGPGSVRALREWITVEGEPRAVQIHEDRARDAGCELADAVSEAVSAVGEEGLALNAGRRRPVWAGRLRVDGITVTVTGRGVPPGGIELKRIEDFERYILGRTDLMRKLAAQQARRVALEERELPSVLGLEAHRMVVEHAVREALAIAAQIRAEQKPRVPRRSRGEAAAVRWEAAVRQQMKLASESREEAGESVTAMVNHLTRLAQHADWAVGTSEGLAAMEEVIRYTVFASEVPSLPAQRAWERLWSGGLRNASAAEDSWLTAWEQWRVERTQH
ncbi:hypothetical protein [Kitasatospora sp. GP82]|uniref:hypothetical protein n=1 Tax=Kitasatospora sp. GP82 TaxID=3035089 RepID=UPI0024771972|nr:hypothetical protein [Kitasatospora sp. GP82]